MSVAMSGNGRTLVAAAPGAAGAAVSDQGAAYVFTDQAGTWTQIAKTKAQVKDKLREAVADLEAGVTTDVRYTVEDAVSDFLAKGLKGGQKKPSATIGHSRTAT